VLLAGVVASSFTATPAAAADCNCANADSSEASGILYRGPRSPSLDEVVRMLAPVLWFSPDEPLILDGVANFPMAHPCDAPAAGPVVYYQVSDLLLRGGTRVSEPPQSDSAFFDKVEAMSVIFFFYYPRDVGMGSHEHDIESVEFDVILSKDTEGCRAVRLVLVKAAAHGQPWYSNRLKPAPGTRYPITILVEEGKHASCTDRNADGRYTPGYDTNQFVNDAWGVRDVFGAGFLFTGNYDAYMTKMRTPETRLLPPSEAPPPCVPRKFSSMRNPSVSRGRYELRPGSALGHCPGMGSPADSTFLTIMMRVNGLGRQTPLQQNSTTVERNFMRTMSTTPQVVPGVSVRWDEQALGLSIAAFGIDLGEGWLVGRLGLVNALSTELMFTRSASRWSDGYFSGGWEWKEETINGEKVQTRNDPVWETGMKFRIGLPEGKIRWLFLNYRFAGLRGGIRFNGVSPLTNARFAVEFGAGVW
jgi:hypothetical protein